MRLQTGTKATKLLVAVAVGVAGCSSDSSTDPDPDPVPTADITVRDDFFQPGTAAVSAGEGVMWTWQGGNPHNVTWDAAELPNSATQTAGSHEVTMPSEPGEYGYHCTVHGSPGVGIHGPVVID